MYKHNTIKGRHLTATALKEGANGGCFTSPCTLRSQSPLQSVLDRPCQPFLFRGQFCYHKMYNSSTIFTSLSAFRILWPRDPTWSHWWQSVMPTVKITGNQVVAMAICRRVALPPQRYNSHHFCANRIIKAYLWHQCAYQCTLWRSTLQLLSNTVGDVIT